MKADTLRHGSLFSGIGGFDLAAAWMGWENVFHCEVDPFCRGVLAYHFPKAKSHSDIRETDFSAYNGEIDIITGGFPCQPFSLAGKRKGTDDERYLWPHMLRAIRQIQPRWIVGENVRGIVTWHEGLVFEEVCTDLEVEGYNVQPAILPAAGIGAPHRRERVWFIAHRHCNGPKLAQKFEKDYHRGVQKRLAEGYEPYSLPGVGHASNPSSDQRCKGRLHPNQSKAPERYPGLCHTWHCRDTWENFPTEPPVCPGDDGVPGELDNITFSKWRRESIKAAGNAIVPQVALQIFKAIAKTEYQYQEL